MIAELIVPLDANLTEPQLALLQRPLTVITAHRATNKSTGETVLILTLTPGAFPDSAVQRLERDTLHQVCSLLVESGELLHDRWSF